MNLRKPALAMLCAALLAGPPLRSPKEAEAFLARTFAERAAIDATRLHRKWLDLPYAVASTAQRLDIYLPEQGKGPFPVIVAIHGGSFLKGDKRDFQIVPMLKAVDRGYAVISINYRLTGEAKFPAQTEDVQAALQWIRVQAGNYGLVSGRIALWGDSAGGYLAAFAAMEDPNIRAVVDWYGPISFSAMSSIQHMEGVGVRLFGKSAGEAPELYAQSNPETHLSPMAPPILIQHGDRDSLIPSSQSVDFARYYRKVAGDAKVTLEIIPDADHLDEKFTTALNVERVMRFLDQYLKESDGGRASGGGILAPIAGIP